jgi:hypothetical protein
MIQLILFIPRLVIAMLAVVVIIASAPVLWWLRVESQR